MLKRLRPRDLGCRIMARLDASEDICPLKGVFSNVITLQKKKY